MQFLPSMQPDQLGGGGKRGLGAVFRAVASLIADIRQTNNAGAAIVGIAAMTANVVLTNGVAIGALLVASPSLSASIKQTQIVGAGLSASGSFAADVLTSPPIPGFANLVTRFSADAITPQADNTSLTSWTDSVNSIVAGTLNGTAPKYRTNRLGGKPSIQFAANGSLGIATPGVLKTALDSQLNTVFIVFKNAAVVDGGFSSFGCMFGASVGGSSLFYNASDTLVGRFVGTAANTVPYSASQFTTLATTSWNTPQHGNGGGYEIQYVNGGAQWSNNAATPATAAGIAIGAINSGTTAFAFSGDIFDILVYNRPLTPAEMKRLQMWACDKYGQAYPWAGLSQYPVYFGDSIMQFGGVSSVQHTAPYLAAQSLGLGLGQWDNLSSGGSSIDTLTTFAPAFVDDIGDTIGIDTPIITFEWFNEQVSTTTKGAAYLAARKAASSRIKTVWGTTTDATSSTQGGSSSQSTRDAYDAAWDALAVAGPIANCDAYMPIHLDPHIGVDQSYLTYSVPPGDGVHLVDATTPYLAAFFVDGIISINLTTLPVGVIFDGDGITAEIGTNTEPYPTYFSTLTTVRNKNISNAGETLATMDTNYAANIAPLFAAGLRDTLSILAGTNDFSISNATDLTLRPIIQSYCGKARATGFKIYVGTITSRNDVSWNATLEGYRVAYNTWLRANFATFCDGIIDFDAIPQSQDPSNNTYFQSDALHPTNALAQLYADRVRTRLFIPVSTFAFNPVVSFGAATFTDNNKEFVVTNANTTVVGISPITGKKFFAIIVNSPGNFTGVGVGINTPTGTPGFDGNKSIANYNNGNAFQNSGSIGTAVNMGTSPMVCAVVDEPNAKLWFTGDGVTFFGLGGSLTKGDVEAGTGAYDLSAIKALGSLYAVAGTQSTTTPTFRVEAYPALPPSGYTQL